MKMWLLIHSFKFHSCTFNMSNCVLLGAYRYLNAGEAAWLIKPFDERVSTSGGLSNLAVGDQKNYSQE